MALAIKRRVNTVCIELTRGAVSRPSTTLILPAIIRDTYGIASEDLCGVAVHGASRIFVKFCQASVYEAVVERYQDVTLTVNHSVSVKLNDVSRYYTWVKIRNVPFEADESDLRAAFEKYGTIHTVGRWSERLYAGIPEGTFTLKMTLRQPIPSYVILDDFKSQVMVSYTGQQHTCHLCGAYDHTAAQCEQRQDTSEQEQPHTDAREESAE
ncbi:uncharacterized protein [Cherax quadricarinatus]|uniref:uncharacterized protein n=1 Tax=Cherax quadricarinatus TaxID=27406 RepID=UPI00237967B8|nr:uncharacterized protein LOC128697449 [Cherax quadricarinatus]